ncbi:MAG TPA: protein kinase, partial [Polyangium sp.]|nr:protein kinase [Polyangium sp.]
MTSDDGARGDYDRGPPLPSQLEETREGGFADKPTTPVNLAQTMQYAAGDVIANKYRLTKILGEGGMGAVWLARNLALEIDVAIKLIRHDYANAEGAMRLLQEARAAARIGHPCIVRVFDFGTTERSDPFIVMEVLQGESLGQTIARKGKLSAISAVRTLLPVAGALAAAHAKGIVHRDLKPDNIRLVTDDRGAVIPKVVDFGIAKLHHDDIPRETTQAGVILGSPHYMSPEQACGRSDLDHRADIWAFSVMLYEVVTGKRPFEGPNYNALISSILVFHPAPWSDHDLAEPELWALVQKGLQKEPLDRWQSMQEYGEALAFWASRRDVETDAAGNSLRAHWLDAATHRPLSEYPPANGVPSDAGRPRMVSAPEIRPRLPSIPELAMPDLVLPNPPAIEKSPEEEEQEQEQEFESARADENQVPDAPPPTTAAPAPPSSLPLATTASKPPERRRSAALWIGPLALTVGAAAVAIVSSAM